MKVAADQTRVSIVAAAGGKPDNDANGFALIKIRIRFLIEAGFGSRRPRLDGRNSKQQDKKKQDSTAPQYLSHSAS
jgi:hypothetical protein